MPRAADRTALVLGAGAIGLSCAYFLRRAGREVTVVDHGEPGHGATWGTAGLLCPAHSQPLPGPGVLSKALRWMFREDSPFHIRWRADPRLLGWLLGFARASTRARSRAGFTATAALSSLSLRLFGEVLERGDADFFFERRGGWLAFLTGAGLAGGRREAEELRRRGFPVEVLVGDAVREREPAFSAGVRGALFLPGDAHGLSLGFAESLARTLRGQGVRLETGLLATRLLLDGEAVRGAEVATADGAREERVADETILALGARTPDLARTAGVRLPILPAKGYSATVRRFAGAPPIPVTVAERKMIVTPLRDRVRFAGTLELTGFDPGLNRRRYQAVIAGARAVLAAPVPLEEEAAWIGFRPLTPDSLPFIGRPRARTGLIIAAGHGMLGFTQSLGTGRLVRELADGAPPSVDPAPFSLYGRTPDWPAGWRARWTPGWPSDGRRAPAARRRRM